MRLAEMTPIFHADQSFYRASFRLHHTRASRCVCAARQASPYCMKVRAPLRDVPTGIPEGVIPRVRRPDYTVYGNTT